MKETLELILANLVENKEDITILEKENGRLTEIEVKVPEKDMGRVIGKQGKTANATLTDLIATVAKEVVPNKSVSEILTDLSNLRSK